MVEFGLKLEDNKVADWSEHYIEYEKLKHILKKCEAADKRWSDLAAKKPLTAAAIADNFYSGAQLDRITEDSTSSDFVEGSESLTEIDENEISEVSVSETERTELVPVVRTSQQDYGSAKGSTDNDSSNSLIKFGKKAASGVTDYFTKSFERQALDALKELENYTIEFDECLVKSLSRLNTFYDNKLHEMEVQLLVLKENVASSRSSSSKAPFSITTGTRTSTSQASPDVEAEEKEQADELETPLVNRRRQSIVHDVAAKMAQVQGRLSLMVKDAGPGGRRNSTHSFLSEEELLYHDDNTSEHNHEDKALLDRKLKEAESIQRALVDQYRTAKLLHNFAIMNYTAAVKIVKKHDKSIARKKGRYKKAVEPENICNEGRSVEALAVRMEHLYANWFCDRNMSEARAQMLPKKGDGLEMDWSQLRFGYRLGMCSILGLWVCWDCVWGLLSNGESTIGGRTAFPVFRATGGLLLLQWFWGCSVWVWTRYRINYIYLFDFNPQIVESPLAIFNRAVDNTLFFLINMLLYYKAGAHGLPGTFPAGVFPLFLVLYTCYQLIFPLRIRVPMWQTIWEVVTSPTTAPTFFHGYVGDIFTSMVKVFQDMLWTICFIISGDWMISEDLELSTAHHWSRTTTYAHILIPLLTLLPLWFRFNQCLRRYADSGDRFPHLANAFKYAMSQTVTLFGAFHPLYLGIEHRDSGFDLFQFFWVTIFVSSSLYSFVWDVYMDWGLGRPSFDFLGPRLMYPQKYGYFVIIAMDLVLRFAWVLTLVPPQSGASFALPQYMTAVSLMLELFRRTIWGFLRLENEHRTSSSAFGRVGFVPLHFSTGHKHDYKKEKEQRGFSVLAEVAVVTLVVLGACTVSVVMAQQATERLSHSDL